MEDLHHEPCSVPTRLKRCAKPTGRTKRTDQTGYDAAGTTDENPERVAIIQRLSLAYLQSTLYDGDPSWTEASAAFAELGDLGSLENKQVPK